MPELLHLDADGVIAIHAEVLDANGGRPGLRDRGLLESAVAAPQASFGGEALLKDPLEVAAAYLFYLCSNHPFVDGNERTALACALVFLQANGLLADPGLPARNVDAWEALVLEVAASKLDRDQTTTRLRKLLSARKPRKKH
ncbi:MAG: type II toxin-antitoxin system death-on-curing family toxin [Betaproteobacteria bacterium]|nr:type II toxin-antitoxin system death-on-curing family toxin [Betaproteobacteria bacterium]